eukprot:gene8340-biopygen10196
MQTDVWRNSEEEGLTGTSSNKAMFGAPKRLQQLKAVAVGFLVLVLFVALAAAIGLAVRLQSAVNACPPPPECLHALGGGPVTSGGGVKGAAPAYCSGYLTNYAENGWYWKEVELAANTAMMVFGFTNASIADAMQQQQQQQQQQHNRRSHRFAPPFRSLLQPVQLTAIDSVPSVQKAQHSSSSRSGGAQPPAFGAAGATESHAAPAVAFPAGNRSLVVVFDIDETVLSNLQQILHPNQWPWDQWVRAAAAPPIPPMLRFYKAACAAGYSLAFVTGRRESQRKHTMDNLSAAGYGGLCESQASGASAANSRGITSSNSSASSNGNGNAGSSDSCCYEALYMRPLNDTRLASVYKPWARRQLLASGKFQLLALFGDQFSDINGEMSAPYAFKLPNPFYYIL